MKNRYIHIFSFVAALLMLATFSACEADDKIVFVTGTDIDKEESEYVSLIDVTDNSDADWNTLPAEYVFETKCADGASLDALKSVKVFADEIYVNLLVEWDTEQVTDLRSVPFHVYWNVDGDAETGGYGDKWLEPYDIDIMMEGFFYVDEEGLGIGEPCAYEPGMFAYGAAYNTNEWNWSELTAAGTFCFSQHLGDNKMEIQFLRKLIPASWGEEFTIGFDIQQNWTDVGVLPNAADDPITGARVRANKLKVKVNTSESSTDTPKENIPVVVTSAVTQITETSAVAGGNVTSDGGASVIERGVVYSTNPNPVITNLNNTIHPCGSGTGEFTYTITGLQSGTKYYIRAYAKNDVGTAYGEEMSFTTKVQATPEYVDLGLSVKWATFNVGASTPEEYGDYFAWGETEPKATYYWSTYKWCYGSEPTLTKYNTDSSYGTVDNKTQLDLSDDAAHVNWGGDWRTPTDAEWTELREQCTWTWTIQNGVKGYKVTSTSNGNSIFLPAAGYRFEGSLNGAGSLGYYWSSSLKTDYSYDAWGVYFDLSGVYRDDSNRHIGPSIRPVYGEKTPPTVTTAYLTQITETSAVAGGTVTNDGNASVTERGVCIATVSNPTTANTKISAGSGTGTFNCNLTNLQPNTKYYVRAYAINSKGTAYGSQVSFTTNGQGTPDYVDLGLSVKWATFNVGASTPEEYGDHFAWGETEPKAKYYWSTYKWCNGSSTTLTKYNTSSSYGTVDNKTQLDLNDDAAHVNWGGDWRMPTDAEWTELREQCTWTWTTQNGVNGYKVTSKKSGYTNNSIFLPAAGYRYDISLYDAGSEGEYLSSSLHMDEPYRFYGVYCDAIVTRMGGVRDRGYSVRAVHQ